MSKPRYTRPTLAAIASYARKYREHGSPAGHHTSMTYGEMPYLADFNRAFDACCPDGDFAFGNDAFVGTDKLNRSQLWNELSAQLATWEEGEHRDGCPGDGECDGSDRCPSEQAGSWCSSVLGHLGFEWI